MKLKSGIAIAVAQAGNCSSDSTPSLGTSICHKCSPKKKKIKIKIKVSRAKNPPPPPTTKEKTEEGPEARKVSR